MTHYQDSKFVPYRVEDIYDLVLDIASYPEFLPWCKAARITSTHEEGEKTHINADLVIAFAAFRERFSSHVVGDKSANVIKVDYLEGPFKNLDFLWKFAPRQRDEKLLGTDVEFAVDFEFRSRILQAAIGQVFDLAMRRVMSAFETRAGEIYQPITL